MPCPSGRDRIAALTKNRNIRRFINLTDHVKMKFSAITACLMLAFLTSFCVVKAQTINPEILNKKWKASWISVPGEPAKDYGVYQFRKTITLPGKPGSFIIHVSGDNRYKLFVNGAQVSAGPARGDIFHWNFETVDLAPFLSEGKNIISALVWNEGEMRQEAQISYRTAFILQGNGGAESILNTDKSWKCIRDNSRSPLPVNLVYSYYVAGPGELDDKRNYTDNWMSANFDDSSWKDAQALFAGLPKGVFEHSQGWMLVPSPLPQMEYKTHRFAKVRKADNVSIPKGFPTSKVSLTIPANTKTSILLDQSFLTNAYPVVKFSSGKDAVIALGYAEALYIDEGSATDWRAQNKKGNRNEIEGKRFVGREDRIISNGRKNQEFTTLSWRTYRYVQLNIETQNEALVIDDLYGIFTGFPFKQNARLITPLPELNQILDIGWRTARLCAFETYMDCPYYEQLQYVGDTRIQAMISYYNAGDDRLAKNAIELLDNSRMAEGITLSRYPTANAQEIPTFSLWWIGMLKDYLMYRGDPEFIKSKLQGERSVLNFFGKYQQKNGLLKSAPYWVFTDWAEGPGWSNGMAPTGKEGNSAALDFQLIWAYQTAAELEEKLGMPEYADKYRKAALQLQETARAVYFDPGKNLFSDTPEKELYSQHVNALAILTETVKGSEAGALAKKLLTDKTLTQASIYFQYYLNQALIKAGLGNEYLNWLGIYRENIKQGMTTWGEDSNINTTRSDCHAWGSHPNIEFYRTVLGIDSDAPGFEKVKIEPHLGTLKTASGEIPHPKGKIGVDYKIEKGKLKAGINLPEGTSGYFLWHGKRYELKEGLQRLEL